MKVELPYETNDFIAAWHTYFAMRAKMNYPDTDKVRSRYRNMLAAVKHDVAVAMLRKATFQHWQSLYPMDEQEAAKWYDPKAVSCGHLWKAVHGRDGMKSVCSKCGAVGGEGGRIVKGNLCQRR